MLLCLVYYSLFFCILFLVARKWHLFVLRWPVMPLLYFILLCFITGFTWFYK